MYVVVKSTKCRTLYCMTVGVVSLLLFLYGFFPMKKYDGSIATRGDFPTSIRDLRLNVSSLYKPVVSRVVIVVIDALRHDFIAGPEGPLNMPYTVSLVEKHEACLLAARASPPTVTMPRIKALTTGTVPNFIDVALNFGSSQILEDNLISQAEKQGLKVVFYGDDTWLKLFPNSFIRKDGTTSFFVSDFHEVDDNVTRHLSEELKSPDWQIMILHYLGLDHIGHIEGPKGSHIKAKLLEMDAIIKRIYQELPTGDEFAIVVCGDHGMKDSGGHGGASLAEILVPFIVIGHRCPQLRSDAAVAQIDLVPTLAILLGLPIPRSNLGKVIPCLINGLPVERQLYALHYNARQVAHQFQRNIAGGSLELEEAVRLHVKWLSSYAASSPDEIVALYSSALEIMGSRLAEAMITYDLLAMAVALSILWQVCYMLLLSPLSDTRVPPLGSTLLEVILLTLLLLSVGTLYCSYSKCNGMLCTNITASVTVVLMAVTNFHIIIYFYPARALKQTLRCAALNLEELLLVLGSGLQVISLGATSLIEEEHQVWYFLWTSLGLLWLYQDVSRGVAMGWLTAANLALHRLLRKWNQTGDKWASLPDIGDWLGQPQHSIYLSLTLLAGLVGVLWSIHILNKGRGLQPLDAGLGVLAVLCIYGYRTATGSVILPCTYPLSRGSMEVQVFWFVLVALLGRLARHREGVVSIWLLLSALLHRPHNVVLLAAQVWTSQLIRGGVVCLTFAHIWLGMLFYFYQGNSNSLASVDVAAGYVGHKGYNPITVGLLLLSNTYCAPVLSYLLLMTRISGQQLAEAWRLWALARLFPVSVYATLVTAQRYHLFVWTVFSPKLLYESIYMGVLLVLLIASNLVTQTFKTKTK